MLVLVLSSGTSTPEWQMVRVDQRERVATPGVATDEELSSAQQTANVVRARFAVKAPLCRRSGLAPRALRGEGAALPAFRPCSARATWALSLTRSARPAVAS
jgi:hypothetical protein